MILLLCKRIGNDNTWEHRTVPTEYQEGAVEQLADALAGVEATGRYRVLYQRTDHQVEWYDFIVRMVPRAEIEWVEHED